MFDLLRLHVRGDCCFGYVLWMVCILRCLVVLRIHEMIYANRNWTPGDLIFAVLLRRRIVDTDGNAWRPRPESPLGEQT